MKNIITILIAILLLASCSQKKELSIYDQYIDYIEKTNQGIGSIVITKEGKTIYQRDFGQHYLPEDGQQKGKLEYQIGSISKMLTATMLFQLIENNELDEEEKLAGFFPEFPNADKITINQLLSHTSGLKNYLLVQDTCIKCMFHPISDQEIRAEIIRQGVVAEPGDSLYYSNSGYFILAKILEQKEGKPYREILDQRIIQPLKLKHTSSADKNNYNPGKSFRKINENDWEQMDDLYYTNVIGVGDIKASLEDLTTITNALFTGKLVRPETLEKMVPEYRKIFGKGIMCLPFYDEIFFGHGGNTIGTHSFTGYNEKDEMAFAISLNGQYIVLNDILIGLLSLMYDKEFTIPDPDAEEVYSPDPEKFAIYEGIYSCEALPMKITIFRKNDTLFGQGTDQPDFPMKAISEHTFENKSIYLEMTFHEDGSGFKMIQFGQEFEFVRDKEDTL